MQQPASQQLTPQPPTAAAAWHGSPAADGNGAWYYQPANGTAAQNGTQPPGGVAANGNGTGVAYGLPNGYENGQQNGYALVPPGAHLAGSGQFQPNGDGAYASPATAAQPFGTADTLGLPAANGLAIAAPQYTPPTPTFQPVQQVQPVQPVQPPHLPGAAEASQAAQSSAAEPQPAQQPLPADADAAAGADGLRPGCSRAARRPHGRSGSSPGPRGTGPGPRGTGTAAAAAPAVRRPRGGGPGAGGACGQPGDRTRADGPAGGAAAGLRARHGEPAWPSTVQAAPAAQPSPGSHSSTLSKLTGAVRGRRAARKPRLAMSAVFADLVDMADIPRSAYAVDEEVTGAMCLFKTDGGYEVFSCAEDARHEVRFFEDEEAAYFYLFGVLAAEALRNGRLIPRRN